MHSLFFIHVSLTIAKTVQELTNGKRRQKNKSDLQSKRDKGFGNIFFFFILFLSIVVSFLRFAFVFTILLETLYVLCSVQYSDYGANTVYRRWISSVPWPHFDLKFYWKVQSIEIVAVWTINKMTLEPLNPEWVRCPRYETQMTYTQ